MYKYIIPKKIDELIEELKKLKESNNITEINIERTPEKYEIFYDSSTGEYDTIIIFHHVNNYNKKETEQIRNMFL